MKTAEELNALKEEVEALNEKLHELTDEELAQVTGGVESLGHYSKFEPADELVCSSFLSATPCKLK